MAKNVYEARSKGVHTSLVLTSRKLYFLFNGIKSYYFSVQKKEDSILFSDYGFGHHIKLCQCGVCAIVRDVWDYYNILAYYNPGTHLMKLR